MYQTGYACADRNGLQRGWHIQEFPIAGNISHSNSIPVGAR